ncbi:phospholipid-binding protein MlaC [Candidatus Nitrosacidococcus sp. I8]|uniref:MlaC/ttg2D family ABC transporter substrate-binding protein n=1 Tax=Candidatus Nitrosacidococcus sp. I8 TaxID=2942908 RepID=UPI0022273329|nr:ABC transporter substrate-binding protein [Candidatus Nitrosacidococcus sp. I8]CAH9019369.1 Intermembrane phospholipid transport system binding protein MlaC [Candidatus Nitrosacidococcus sp. I8]
MIKQCKTIGIFFLIALGLNIAQAGDNLSPRDVVLTTSQKVLEELKDKNVNVNDNPEFFYDIANKYIVPHFNFKRLSQRALGKYWRDATDQQKTDFTDQFRQLLLRTYIIALTKYSAEDLSTFIKDKIQVPPVNYPPDAKRVDVRVIAERDGGGDPANIVLRLYLDKEKDWKVDDVLVEGISLITNYRAEFSNKIHTNGMQALIDELASHNKEVMEKKATDDDKSSQKEKSNKK